MASTFFLRFAATCRGCGKRLPAGARAHRGPVKDVRCALCGPFPLEAAMSVTVLPPGRARGALDSTKKPIMTKAEAKDRAIGRRAGALTPEAAAREQAKAKKPRYRKPKRLREATAPEPAERRRPRDRPASEDAVERLAEHFRSRR